MNLIRFSSELFSDMESGQLADGTPYVDKQALLFTAGQHKGKTYTEADLDKMVAQFVAPGDDNWDTPIQLDHSDSARDTQGHVRKVWRDGQKLFGVLRFVGQEACSKVAAGLWKRLSIAIFNNLKIREVSVTPFPHVGVAQVFEEETMETKDPAAPETTPAQAGETFVVQMAKQEEQFAARTAALENQMRQMQQTISQQQQVIRFTELAGKVETFCADGKTLPVMREAELELLKTFSDEQIAKYEKLKAAQPVFVQFGVMGKVAAEKPMTEQTDEELDAEVEAAIKRRKGAK